MAISVTDLFEKLKPFILGLFEGVSGGSGPFAPSPHELDGVHHTGTLDDAQAPQFLKTDGSRDLTGNLDVDSGVTIDGVDISAHAAANAVPGHPHVGAHDHETTEDGGLLDHALALTNVLTDQHHVRYTDAEALAASMDKIIRWSAGTVTAYDRDNSGLVSANGAASSGDTIWAPGGTFTTNITVTSGVELISLGSTLSGAYFTLNAGSALEGWAINRDENTTSQVYCVYADLDVTERAYVRHCKITVNNDSTGQTDGIFVEGEGQVRVHDCEITAYGDNSTAVHTDTTLSAGGAALEGEDTRDSSSIAENTWVTESDAVPDTDLTIWVYPSATDTVYSYFILKFKGSVSVTTDWGAPPSTPVLIELQSSVDYDGAGSGWPGPDLLEYWNEQAQAWETVTQVIRKSALVNVDTLSYSGQQICRVKRTVANPNHVCKFFAFAKANRANTDGSATISMLWTQDVSGAYVEDSVLRGGEYDLYAENGNIEVAGNDWNPRSHTGNIIAAAGDSSAWDTVNYPENHAADVDGAPLIHHTADQIVEAVGAVTREPGGFYDWDNIDVSYDYTTQEMTLTHASGTLTYYVDGVKFELTSPWTSDAHTATDAVWFLSDDGTGEAWDSAPWLFWYAQFALAYYNATKGVYFGLRECHGLMPYPTHEEFHDRLGTYRVSGGDPTTGTYTEQPSSPADADNTPGFDAAVIKDEGLRTSLPAWIQGTYTHLYFSGTGDAEFDTTATLPFRVGTTYPIINDYSGGTFTDTETVTGRYFNVYQVLMPVTSDTESQKYRVLMLQPQKVYSVLESAEAESFQGIYLGGLAALSPEYVAYVRLTYRTSASYSGATGRSRIESIAYLEGSRVNQTIIGGGGTDSDAIHKSVSGEILTITEKVTPVAADLLVIEDSADSYNKKRVQIGNFPYTSGSGVAGQVTYWDGVNSITGSTNFTYSGTVLGLAVGDFDLDNTVNSNQRGIITKGGVRFIHDFEYGEPNGGGYTPVGKNIFIGELAGNLTMGATATSNSHSSSNVGIGYKVLEVNAQGYRNVALGFECLAANTDGYQNWAGGIQALAANTTGNNNFAGGPFALLANVNGSSNVALGPFALSSNISGSFNVALSQGALGDVTTTNSNIGIGDNAGDHVTGTGVVAIGYYAVAGPTGSFNVGLGYQPLGGGTGGANANVAIGYQTMYSATSAYYNNAIGYQTLRSITTGSDNNAIGLQALYYLQNGFANFAGGRYAGFELVSGTYNVFLGHSSGRGITTGSYNTILGAQVTGLATNLANTVILADGQGDIRLYSPSSGYVGIGGITAVDRLFHVEASDAETVAITYATRTSHTTSGTAAPGFGVGHENELRDAAGNMRVASYVETLWHNAGAATYQADMVFSAVDYGGTREGVRIRGSGSAPMLGFYGGTPVVRGAALTTQLTTITYTAPTTPDYAIQDLVDSGSGSAFGFATKDEGNTVLSVIENLQARVAELEARLGSATGVNLFV